MSSRELKKLFTVLVLIILAALSCISPPRSFGDVLLNHVGTVLVLLLLVLDIYKRFLSYPSFLGIALFCAFHILGARYLYSFVPYNEWSVTVFGWDMDAYFNFTRNHYDRLVHFIFGILIFPFLLEWFSRKNKMQYRHAILFAWLTLQSFSMIYELIEWCVALLFSVKSAENYNGQQGDVWDAHKDMALALLGSTMAAVYYFFRDEKKIYTS